MRSSVGEVHEIPSFSKYRVGPHWLGVIWNAFEWQLMGFTI